MLGRQALEAALHEWWLSHAPGGQAANFRAQLVCFGEECSTERAHGAAYLWAVLSGACHFHGYELAPSGELLHTLLEGVEDVVEQAGG